MDEKLNLPDKVTDIELLKVRRNMRKICSCEDKTFTVDTTNRAIWCSKCDAWIDPFDAMVYLATHIEKFKNTTEYYLNRAKEYANYKPHLRVFKHLEQHHREQNYGMVPICPECKKPFEFEKIDTWVNKRFIRKDDADEFT